MFPNQPLMVGGMYPNPQGFNPGFQNQQLINPGFQQGFNPAFQQGFVPGVQQSNPYMVGQQILPQNQMMNQGYQYPTMQEVPGVYPGTNMGGGIYQQTNQQQNNPFNVGSIYTGPTAMPTAPQTQNSPAVPGGAPYPNFFQAYTGVNINQCENLLNQSFASTLRRSLEGAGARAFAKHMSNGSLNQSFATEMLTRARQIAQILIMGNIKPSTAECISYAVHASIYGQIVYEIGGVNSPDFKGYEMVTGTDLRGYYGTLSQILENPKVYTDAMMSHLARYREMTAQQPSAPLQPGLAAVTAPVQQGLGSINVNIGSGGGMVDPLDVAAEALHQQRMEAFNQQQQQLQQQQAMAAELERMDKINSNVTVQELQQQMQPQQAPVQQTQQPPMNVHIPAPGQPLGLPRPKFFNSAEEIWEWEDRNTAYIAEQKRMIAQVAAHQESPQQQQTQQVQQPVEAPVVQQQVIQQQAPVVEEVQAPAHRGAPSSHIYNLDLNQKSISAEQKVVAAAGDNPAAIKTTPNGRVLPGGATTQAAPSNYYNFGAAETMAPQGVETTADGEEVIETQQEDENVFYSGVQHTAAPEAATIHPTASEIEADDRFAQLVHDQEAENQAAIDAMNEQCGNPQSLSEIMDQARAKGIQPMDPELRLDYLNIQERAREQLCRDNRIRRVPVYLKGKHNLIYVSRGAKHEVVLEEVESVDYLKHETEFHNVKRYNGWDGDATTMALPAHMKTAAEKCWTADVFVEKLQERLEGVESQAEQDKALAQLLAERPRVEIEDLVTNSTSEDEYLSEISGELAERGVDDIGYVTDNAIISYNRINTSRLVVDGDNVELFTNIHKQTSAAGIVECIQLLKQNANLPTREVGRLLKVFSREVNTRLKIVFTNGWSTTDVLGDLPDLTNALTAAYPDLTLSVVLNRLHEIYIEAALVAFNYVASSDAVSDFSGVAGNTETVVLIPAYYADYPIAKTNGVAFLGKEEYPELNALLSEVSDGVTPISLVMLDNVVMKFVQRKEDGFFLVAIDE